MGNELDYTSKLAGRLNNLSDDKYDLEVVRRGSTLKVFGDDYFKFQDQGVKGTKSGSSDAGYAYGDKMPPPNSFSKYTADRSKQFAIARSVQQKGIAAEGYTKEFENDVVIDDIMEDLFKVLIENNKI